MRTCFLAAVGVFILVGLSTGLASAAVRLKVDVPFAFVVNGVEHPAGSYEVREAGPDLTILEVEKAGGGKATATEILTRIADVGLAEPEVVFDQAGGKSYLSEVLLPKADGLLVAGAPGKHTHQRVKAAPAQ